MAALVTKFKTKTINATTEVGTLDLHGYLYLSYQIDISGTLLGTLQLWISNDNINFTQRTDAAYSITKSGTNLIEIVNPCIARYHKWIMNVSSGSGTVLITPCAKGNT
jgi:hypothetical protein